MKWVLVTGMVVGLIIATEPLRTVEREIRMLTVAVLAVAFVICMGHYDE